ncbi:Ku protein [Mesorhizobium sp. 1M-11]|uniref:non-homologous end joining protein Ku n=1 Tax=Mesorhizobium sp. 1M-11 TaxID=1529006 RepID=UPI0006C74E17|nr:Ku protein [Mesorhizobium sp. 1M-11]
MARQAFWKGYLKLSLVTCSVAMTPAVSGSEQIRFHTLNRKTENRVQSRYVDAETGKPVAEDDEAKGYEAAEGKLVVLSDKELDAVALESTRTIDIDMFVPRQSIGWIWYDRPHFLTPNDKVGEEAFAVIRDAMQSAKVVGIARLVLYRREHAVMLEPRGKGIVLWTLRYGDEVRDADDYFAEIGKEKPAAKPMSAMRKVIAKGTYPWNDKFAHDQLQDRLRRLISRRRKSMARPGKGEKRKSSDNVISITDALRASLASERRKS